MKIESIEEQFENLIKLTLPNIDRNSTEYIDRKRFFFAAYAASLHLVNTIIGYMDAKQAEENMKKLMVEAEEFFLKMNVKLKL